MKIRQARRRKPVRFVEIPSDQRLLVEACKAILLITGTRPIIEFRTVMPDDVEARIRIDNTMFSAGDVIYREPGRKWAYSADIDHFLETFEVTS